MAHLLNFLTIWYSYDGFMSLSTISKICVGFSWLIFQYHGSNLLNLWLNARHYWVLDSFEFLWIFLSFFTRIQLSYLETIWFFWSCSLNICWAGQEYLVHDSSLFFTSEARPFEYSAQCPINYGAFTLVGTTGYILEKNVPWPLAHDIYKY